MEKKVLGRGISALIPEKPKEEKQPVGGVLSVSPDLIKPNPLQPRENFDPQTLEELTQSIREKGVIQPVLVRQKGDYYELIAGERRLRAAKSLNLKEIPIIIRDVEDEDSLELALIENIQRQDLNPIEEARAYQYLIEKFHITQERLSDILGKARVSVTNTLRILKLPQEIQEEMKKGRLSFAHGRALLEVEDVNQQRRLAQEVIARRLSIRELESLIKKQRPRLGKLRSRRQTSDPYVAAVEEQLQHLLATRVKIVKQKKRGHVVIEFYSQEDLDRILTTIKGGKDA